MFRFKINQSFSSSMGDSETVVAATKVSSDMATSTGTSTMDVDNAVLHEDSSGVTGKSEGTDVNTSHEAPVTAFHSSVNGNDVSDEKSLPADGVSENGVSSYDHGSASANQPVDGSGIILTLLDFN